MRTRSINNLDQPNLPWIEGVSSMGSSEPVLHGERNAFGDARPIFPTTTKIPSALDSSPLAFATLRVMDKAVGHSRLTNTTGAECMQARAHELYDALAVLSGVSELELRRPGPAISLADISNYALRKHYLNKDFRYEDGLRLHAECPRRPLDTELFRASDSIRKRIGRAVRDLRLIGALEVNAHGYLTSLHRLPYIQRVLEEKGVTSVRKCPGGKRVLCNVAGAEVNLELKDARQIVDEVLALNVKAS